MDRPTLSVLICPFLTWLLSEFKHMLSGSQPFSGTLAGKVFLRHNSLFLLVVCPSCVLSTSFGSPHFRFAGTVVLSSPLLLGSPLRTSLIGRRQMSVSDSPGGSSGWMAATPGPSARQQQQQASPSPQNFTPRLTSTGTAGNAFSPMATGMRASIEGSRNGTNGGGGGGTSDRRRHRSSRRSQSRAAAGSGSGGSGPLPPSSPFSRASTGAGASGRSNASLNRALVELALDPSLELLVAPRTRPWRWLGAALAIVGVYAASDALTALSQSFPAFTGPSKDAFITAAWFVHYAGMVCFLLGSLVTFLRRHPFHWSLLLLYMLALCSFVAASVLHTTRLDVSAATMLTNPDGSQRVLAVQLSWLANLAFFALFAVLAYRAPDTQISYARPGGPDAEKVKTLFVIKEAETARSQLAALLAQQDVLLLMAQQAAQAHEEQRRTMHTTLQESQRLEATGIIMDATSGGTVGTATTAAATAGDGAMVELNSHVYEGLQLATPAPLQSPSPLQQQQLQHSHSPPPPHYLPSDIQEHDESTQLQRDASWPMRVRMW